METTKHAVNLNLRTKLEYDVFGVGNLIVDFPIFIPDDVLRQQQMQRGSWKPLKKHEAFKLKNKYLFPFSSNPCYKKPIVTGVQ